MPIKKGKFYMQLDDRIARHINQWISIAEEDLRVAEFTFQMQSSIPYRMIAFHAQQAAEKFLKALLLYYNIDFPFTHDLRKLIELIPADLNLNEKLESIIILTDYAVNRRYPDFYKNLTEAEAREAVNLSKFTRDTILNILQREGFNISTET
jgi:HEPN domain-containing protein